MADSQGALFSERCKLTSAIVLLDAAVMTECVLLLAIATNPFFGAMSKPTPAFIAFMVLQILVIGVAGIAALGACACKERLVRANRHLFFFTALVNVVYAVAMFATGNSQGGLTFAFLALLGVMGAMLSRRFALLLSQHHAPLPTRSPSYAQQKASRV
ncbi:hypothetical protein ATCC90586_011733 [Pythium insidiosum]|nr:hypothetical protein ATCC90586_011733 [Pythium insidiosum]